MTGCPDGRCDGTGFLYDEERRQARDCSCRPRRLARRHARKLAGVIPRRYQGVSFDRPPVTTMNPPVVREVRRYVDALDERLAVGRGLWFSGDVGTGKTTLAMLVSRTALEAGRSVAIYSLPRLLGLLRESFDDTTEHSLTQLLDSLAAVDLLHIDDVGAEQSSSWVLEQLYTIVNTRYEDRRAVLITTNLDDLALRAQIGDRTVSRLVEMCGDPLPLFGADQRMEPELRARRLGGAGESAAWAPAWGSGADDADLGGDDPDDPDDPPGYGRARTSRARRARGGPARPAP